MLIKLEPTTANIEIAPNLRYREYACPLTGQGPIVPMLVYAWKEIRLNRYAGRIRVVSGFRSPAYNDSVAGSSKHSKHMLGEAMDWAPVNPLGWGYFRSVKFLLDCWDCGIRGVGQAENQIHVDVHERDRDSSLMTIWTYPYKPENIRKYHRTDLENFYREYDSIIPLLKG